MKAQDLMEMVAGDELQQLAHKIFQMSEKEAYDNAAEAGTGITHDQILQIAQSIIKTLEDWLIVIGFVFNVF